MTKKKQSIKSARSNNNDLTRARRLAAEILGQLNGVLTMKLRELKPKLEELRVLFKKLGKGQRIEGCRTWAQFCSEKLHRTDRAVRKLLAEVKDGETEETHTGAEESFAVSDEAKGTYEAPDAEQEEASVSEEEEAAGVQEDDQQNEQGAEDQRTDKARKNLRHLFGMLDSADFIQSQLNKLLNGMTPLRKFQVTVVEIEISREVSA